MVTDLLSKNNIKRYSRCNSIGDAFAKIFKHTNTNLLEKPLFESGDASWIDALTTISNK